MTPHKATISSNAGPSLGSFARLPLELRLIIWGYVTTRIALGNDLIWPDPRSTHGGAVRDRRNALAILRVSKTIFAEVIPVIYEGKRFLLTIDNEQPAAWANDWVHYLQLDDSGPEHMPGPQDPDSSPTAWWHLLSRIDVSIVGPLTAERSNRLKDPDELRGRIWGLMALWRKVNRLVTSLCSVECRGLPSIDIEVCDYSDENATWFQDAADPDDGHGQQIIDIRRKGPPSKALKRCPWNDLEIVLAQFKRIRNCRDVSITGPWVQSSYPLRFCFDFPKTIEQTMTMPAEEHRLDSYDAVLISEIKKYCELEILYWEKDAAREQTYQDALGTYRSNV